MRAFVASWPSAEAVVTTIIPSTVRDVLGAACLSALEAALAPPADKRAPISFDLEIEAVGEGTFTLRYELGAVSGKKGFAKRPLLSIRLEKGAFGILRDELQAAVDGFPHAPELKRRLDAVRALDAVTATAAHKAAVGIAEGTCIHFDITGEGRISVARGPVDEATRELIIVMSGPAVRGLLTGASPTSVSPTIKGDRSVGTTVLTAMSPLLNHLR